MKSAAQAHPQGLLDASPTPDRIENTQKEMRASPRKTGIPRYHSEFDSVKSRLAHIMFSRKSYGQRALSPRSGTKTEQSKSSRMAMTQVAAMTIVRH